MSTDNADVVAAVSDPHTKYPKNLEQVAGGAPLADRGEVSALFGLLKRTAVCSLLRRAID